MGILIISCFILYFCAGLLIKRLVVFCISTRVVQKLVETLSTKQQISMVISALEPGFLALMKDLNGSHLIKRCLQCFPIEDKKVILLLSTTCHLVCIA